MSQPDVRAWPHHENTLKTVPYIRLLELQLYRSRRVDIFQPHSPLWFNSQAWADLRLCQCQMTFSAHMSQSTHSLPVYTQGKKLFQAPTYNVAWLGCPFSATLKDHNIQNHVKPTVTEGQLIQTSKSWSVIRSLKTKRISIFSHLFWIIVIHSDAGQLWPNAASFSETCSTVFIRSLFEFVCYCNLFNRRRTCPNNNLAEQTRVQYKQDDGDNQT